MAIAFPTTGLTAGVTVYSYSGRTWLWTGTVWQSVGTVSGSQGTTGSTGPQGATGQSIQGATGQSIQGTTGSAATIAVGTTTTGAAATAAAVTNSGTSSAATFNFTIPQGIQGATGADSTIQGPTGTAASIAVGTTYTGTAGTAASVQNMGTSTSATLQFVIPQGIQGATGAASTVQGPAGTSVQGSTGAGYSGVTSTSSQSVSIGAKTWTLNTANAFITGDRIRAIQSTSNYVEGTATITGTTLTMTSDVSVGTTGPYTNWTFSIAGLQGIQGTQGNQGIQGTTLALRNAQTTNYTIVPGDSGLIVSSTGTGTQYLSIPTNTAQAITIGSQIHFVGMSTGTYTIQAVTSGTTNIQSTGATPAAPKLRAQYAMATAIKLAAEAWIVTGDIS